MRKTTIDIGTNTILMLIADFDESTFKINTVVDIQRIPRLGKGVDSSRNILPESFQKAINILNEYKQISKKHHSEQITATATSFIRDSHNKHELISEIKKHTGIEIEILPGEEEARWTFWGGIFDKIQNSNNNRQIFTIDIGGGSTEITSASNIPAKLNKEILLTYQIKGKSFNIGSVRLNEKFLKSHPPSVSAVKKAEEFINESLSQFEEFDKSDKSDKLLIGVAGTITTLGTVKLRLPNFDRESVDGVDLTYTDIENLQTEFSSKSLTELYKMGDYMEGRADIIIPGTLILKCFMEKFGLHKLTVSTRGLRYGIFLREVLIHSN